MTLTETAYAVGPSAIAAGAGLAIAAASAEPDVSEARPHEGILLGWRRARDLVHAA